MEPVNEPPLTKKRKVTFDPLSSQQTPSAGNEQPETTEAKAVNESSKSEQVLNEAMKAGFVRVNTTNILFFGMAGTGKTSTKHLLLGLPPPQDRNSTPLASTAERIRINRQIRDTTKLKMVAQEDPSRTWKPVTSDDLQRIVADAIKYYVSSSDPNSELSAIPQELSIALKQLEAINESDMEVDTIRSAGAGAQERERSKSLNTVSNVMANIKRFSDYDHTAVQEKFGSHWIYMIDSGGQPHFHNLLPLFTPKISVALYIFRLCDYLDDHPLIEYYKDNEPVGEGFKSHLSVLDNFKYLVQSIQSHSENCKLICIGTHKDHQSECKETLSDKNKTLLNFADKEDCIKKSTMFFNLRKTDVIFPVDCKHCDSDSKDVAQTIRAYIHKLSQNLNINNEVLVPLWWFVLEIIVEKVSNDENRQVLSKTECVEIAKALHNFHEDALCEALKFFHEHHIFHYYPAILPNVVFCDTQVLLDKATELVEFAAYSRGGNTSIHGLRNFTDKGIITIELLSHKNFEKHYVDGLFAPTHLIEIFKHLLIATPFGIFSRRQDKRFYMPSLLSLLPPTQVNDKRAELLKTGLIPLVLHFKTNWQCCGVFCCLQVYLIKECEWEIEMEDHQPSRNFVQLIHQKRNCTITLIDGFSILELYSSNNQKKILLLIYENIHSGLRSAYKALKYTYKDPDVAFLCPCVSQSISSPSPQVPHHPARVLAEDDVMRCTLCKKMTYQLEDGHKDWLSACKLEDYLASTQRKRSLPSDKEVETLSKRPKNDVTVQGPISIVKHPDNKHIKPGYRVEFTVKMQPPPEKYQWYFQEKVIGTEGDDYSGATTYCLQIKRCFSQHTGSYRCGGIDAFGHETKSNTADLTIDGEIIGPKEVNLLNKMLKSSGIQSLNGREYLTYEEVQVVLYDELTLHINIKENLKSRVEEEHLYQEAIMNGRTVCLRYLKLLLLGPGLVGKSTFLDRLLGEMKWDIDSDPKPHCSTKMARLQQVCIKYTPIAAAVTTDGNWHTIEELHSQVAVLTSMLVNEEVHVKEVGNTKLTESQRINKPEAESHQPQVQCNSHSSTLPTSTQERLGATTSTANLKLDYKYQQDTLSPNIANVLNKYNKLRYNLRVKPQILTDTLLNIVDVGGQPAFLDMLPSLTIGPAMYLVFMKLLDGLGTEHPVTFKPDVDTDPIVCEEYTYTSEDIIFTTLSSIACFGNSDAEIEEYIASDNKSNKLSSSITLLLGTFKDEYLKATKEVQLVVDQNETELKTRLKDTGLHNIEYYDREKGQIFFRVNNKNGGEKEIVIYRKRLEELIANRFRKYKIPVRWLMLSICLKLLAIEEGGHFVSLKYCNEIGELFEMTSKQVTTALKFLHRYIGLVMYFPDNEKLRDIVICDPQVIFLSISEIIFDVYASTNSKLHVDKYHHFIHRGCFSLKDIETKRKDLLPVESLVELLVHLNIAAPIPSSTEYFLPAVLRSMPSTVFVPNLEPNLEPMFIRFQTGFVPLGFVCAFMANLIARIEFNLLGEDVYKNHIEVSFKGMLKIILISCPRYCKFYVSQLPNAYDKTVDFVTVRKELCKVADDVINALQHGSVYKLTIKTYELAFRCPNRHKKIPNEMEFGNEQLASVIFDDHKRFLKCSNLSCQVKMKLSKEMKRWYYKALQIIKQPNLNTRNEITTISMSAEGAEPLSYQWFHSKTMISDDQGYQGSNSSILTISKIASRYGGDYTCQIKDCDGQFLFSDKINYDVHIVVHNKLKREGLPDKDIATLKGQGFTTPEGFRELNQRIVTDLNLTKGGKLLLTKLISKHVENSGYTTVQASVYAEQPSSNLSGSILTLNDLSSVYEKLIKAARNWFDLGLVLKMSPDTLCDIRDRYRDNQTSLREMLTARLETATLTYSELCQSLRAPTVRRDAIAEAIEKECTVDNILRQKLSTTNPGSTNE
ncbi:uncharacterized protein LOC135348600 isoform X3 [Halichondria panicea]|uniref:uncharacterized protein LOC135348600 isoform X3 n=1 Tax=Halichondria panicea TaxID=6063 RepID=UPI00312BA54A